MKTVQSDKSTQATCLFIYAEMLFEQMLKLEWYSGDRAKADESLKLELDKIRYIIIKIKELDPSYCFRWNTVSEMTKEKYARLNEETLQNVWNQRYWKDFP